VLSRSIQCLIRRNESPDCSIANARTDGRLGGTDVQNLTSSKKEQDGLGKRKRLPSVPEPLVHDIEEMLSTPESFKLRKEESRRIVEPVKRVVGAMG